MLPLLEAGGTYSTLSATTFFKAITEKGYNRCSCKLPSRNISTLGEGMDKAAQDSANLAAFNCGRNIRTYKVRGMR